MQPSNKPKYFIKRFVVGPMAENCYLAADPATREVCLIDPGADGSVIKNFITKNRLDLKFIINTHGHGDHIACNAFFGVPVYIHRLDMEFLTNAKLNLSSSFFFKITSPKASRLLEDDDSILLGSLKFEVMHTPGHTPGSISLKLGNVAFTGDTLFKDGVGRTDFEYGDQDALFRSIRDKLLTLKDDVIIYPGHGDPSTIGEERRTNPFLT